MKHVLIFAAVNFAASILSGAAGGGGSLVGVPTMILLGLSPTTAIATSKFAGFGMASGGSLRFYREKLTTRRTVITFALVGAVGGALGSLFLVHVGSHHQLLLQRVTGVAILFIGIPVLYLKNLGIERHQRSRLVQGIGFGLIFAIVAFQAAFSAGMGAVQTIILMSFFGMTALVASATRRAMQLIVAITSLTILLLAGLPDLKYGLAAFMTAICGSYIGAHIAIKKGNKFVINLFAITSAILALQLLWR